MALVAQPCADPSALSHFRNTVRKPVPLSRVIDALTSGQRASLPKNLPDAIAVWGVTAAKNQSNAMKWRRMQAGDTVLFYKERRFFARAIVLHTLHSRELAEALWKLDERGQPWEYIYFLTDLKSANIRVEIYNQAARYKPNAQVQGFHVFDKDMSSTILDALELEAGSGT